MRVFLTIVVAMLVIVVASFVFGWITMPFQVASVQNVQGQYAFAYTYSESLKAEAQQVCTAEKGVANASSPDEKTQRESQLEVLQMNYSRIQAEYNAKLRDAFEAKYVRPSDVPATAPSLNEMKLRVCSN
jgi:type II secretory pathway pseudopilin PulG